MCIFGGLARGHGGRIGRLVGRQRKTSSYGSIADSETQSWLCRLVIDKSLVVNDKIIVQSVLESLTNLRSGKLA